MVENTPEVWDTVYERDISKEEDDYMLEFHRKTNLWKIRKNSVHKVADVYKVSIKE
jgi:hypothetical protein